MNNRTFAAKSDHFRKLCEKAGIEPTKRQASKFRQGRGLARAQHKGELRKKHLDGSL